MKKLVATLSICSLLAACGGGRGLRQASTYDAARFEFEGKVVTASKSKKELNNGPSKTGSIALQLSSSHTSVERCALVPPRVVVIPFGPNTSFEPIDLTAAATFPESLDGLTLNVQGNFEGERNCSPVATSVKDLTVPVPQAETSESTPEPAGSSPPKAATGAQPGTNGAAVGAAVPEHSAPAPPPAAASSLPPLAPVVTTSFRPSLPDPPSG
jgi:hypothetical protein